MNTVIKQQSEVRVFINEVGEIAIAQNYEDLDMTTHCVTFWPECAEALIRAIRIAKRKAQGVKE